MVESRYVHRFERTVLSLPSGASGHSLRSYPIISNLLDLSLDKSSGKTHLQNVTP